MIATQNQLRTNSIRNHRDLLTAVAQFQVKRIDHLRFELTLPREFAEMMPSSEPCGDARLEEEIRVWTDFDRF